MTQRKLTGPWALGKSSSSFLWTVELVGQSQRRPGSIPIAQNVFFTDYPKEFFPSYSTNL